MQSGAGVDGLVDRHPKVTPEQLVARLVPPPTFADVSFDTYRPDPAEPSQAAAVQPWWLGAWCTRTGARSSDLAYFRTRAPVMG